MMNQSVSGTAFSRDLRRMAAKSQGAGKARGQAKNSQRGGSGCCILLIIIIVAIIAYIYIDAYVIHPSGNKKTSMLDIRTVCSAAQIHKDMSVGRLQTESCLLECMGSEVYVAPNSSHGCTADGKNI